MKRTMLFLCSVLFVFSFTQQGEAVSITDTYDPGHIYMSHGKNHLVTWTFDLTQYGFDPRTQDVFEGRILLNMEDDGRDRNETAMLRMGKDRIRWEVDTGEIAFSLDDMARMSETGLITFTLMAKRGDFYFNGARICIDAKHQ